MSSGRDDGETELPIYERSSSVTTAPRKIKHGVINNPLVHQVCAHGRSRRTGVPCLMSISKCPGSGTGSSIVVVLSFRPLPNLGCGWIPLRYMQYQFLCRYITRSFHVIYTTSTTPVLTPLLGWCETKGPGNSSGFRSTVSFLSPLLDYARYVRYRGSCLIADLV